MYPRPPSRTAPGDHYNNNSSAPNPYSRNAVAPKTKSGRQSSDPWDWGWEENSSQQDDWNNGWTQSQVPVPNVIPNPPPTLYHSSKPEKNSQGTPDLIPEKLPRGNDMQMNQQHYNKMANSSDFFENIDLVAQNNQSTTLPPMYNFSHARPSQQPNLSQNYPPMFQPVPPQNPVSTHSSSAYFNQPNLYQPVNNEAKQTFYQQPISSHNPNRFQPSQYFQPSVNDQIVKKDHNNSYYNQDAISNPNVGGQIYNQDQLKTPNSSSNLVEQNHCYSQNHDDAGNFFEQNQGSAPKQDGSNNFYNQDSIGLIVPDTSESTNFQGQGQETNTKNDTTNSFYQKDQVLKSNNSSLSYNSSNLTELGNGGNSQDQVTSPKLENSGTFYPQDLIKPQNMENTSNSFYKQDPVKDSFQDNGGNFYNQDQNGSSIQGNFFSQNAYKNSAETNFEPTKSVQSEEVENIEIAPPEQRVSSIHPPCPSSAHNLQETQNPVIDNTVIPDNQETVPDNEEQLPNLSKKLNQMKISSGHGVEAQWNSSAGWENQEVAPRCELDRNQYLETGQLDSNEAEELPQEIDNNDEGEALPPPGLHRMVTGQGTESLSERSVLGQPPSRLERLVPGQPTPSASPTPLQRHPPRYPEPSGDLQRLVPGQVENDPSIARMVPGQLSDDENNPETTDFERMIPGGTSEHESSFPGDAPFDERMVPGGMSDDSRSQSITNDDDTSNSERLIPGMLRNTEPNNQVENQTERLVTGAGSTDHNDPTLSSGSSQEVDRHVVGQRSEDNGAVNQPPLGLHRLVLGQITTAENTTTADHSAAKTSERIEESLGANPPHGMHRMVVGQFREKEGELENDKEKDKIMAKNDDREEDDSDSDYRSERRRHRNRKDSYSDERKERDYSSEREYRGRREDRRDHRKKRERDSSYNRSPEYRSDHEDYDRNEYRDRRERDRRDRPRDRDRRRRSPDYSYDQYYRDDPRKLPSRERDRRYYEPYDEDPYYYREARSRPSSRSGSEYRRHRDYPPRQPYYPEQGGYMHYYQIQQFYENMRRTDPQAYALWYERYMAEKFGNASNDRASVHSGRSSANDNSHLNETYSRRRLKASTPFASPAKSTSHLNLNHSLSLYSLCCHNEDDDRDGVKAEDAASHRSTPPLYNSAHIRGQFNVFGQLVVINPQDPFSYGEHQATVTMCKVAGPNAADSPDVLEFLHNPGPFISGVTHKNTVLQFLKKQCDQSSHSSEKLLYELIRLVIKLNGVVDMTDVADLLMESYRSSSNEDDYFPATQEVDDTPQLSTHQITSKFRELLLEGNKTEALEWAMKNKDWGHALFLASKMDSRTHNNVMLRFANGLQNNDPLQTLYQLMSGREPQAATCAADKKWGDWRPHLAMMLSNRTSNIQMDRKAILTLGDSLGARGRLFAAHFCYLTAQLEFSNYSDQNAKLVLLGVSPDRPFNQFATCRAIMLTLCYEFAKQLSNKDWCIPTLRPYKFLLACRLFDHGNLTPALGYLEALAQEMVRLPVRDDQPLARLVVDMADRIKCADNSLSYEQDPTVDPDWLARLKVHVEESNDPNYLSSCLNHGISTSTVSELEPYSGADHITQPIAQDINQAYPQDMTGYTSEYQSGVYSQENNYYDPSQNNYYSQNAVQSQPEVQQQMTGFNTDTTTQVTNSSGDYWQPNLNPAWDQQTSTYSPSTHEVQQEEQVPSNIQPQISVKPSFGYFTNAEENLKPQVEKPMTASASEKTETKEKSNRRAIKTQQGGSGWFGGIWDKLNLRPKNQMKLPDDKNPTIVWDEKTKKWVNTDASEEEQNAQFKPPPKASELNGPAPQLTANIVESNTVPATIPTAIQNSGPSSLPPPSTANKYKLQRGKGSMRANYVDVMSSNTKPVSSTLNSQPFTPVSQAPVTNFFVPAPIPGNENAPVDFLSPSGPVSYEPSTSKSDDQPPQLSRSSSASSLSREVTYYMSRRQPGPRPCGFGKGNTYFNPSSYQQ